MQLKELLAWFSTRNAYRRLSDSSQEQYDILILQGVALLGPEKAMESVTAIDADNLYDTLSRTVSLHKAVSVCRILRRCWNVAQRYGIIFFNPFAKMSLETPSHRTVMWEPDQIDDFIAASVSYGLPAIGLLVLLCYTFAQRPGDMRTLKWEQYYGNGIHFIQEKTKKEMHIQVPVDLAYELDLVEKVGPYIVTREDTLRPFTKDDYSPIFREVRSLALLPKHLQIRDTRRTALTEAAEHNATDSELQALGGHDTRSTLNIYQIRTQKLTENIQNRRFRA